MAEQKGKEKRPERKREIGRVNNEKDKGHDIPVTGREVGITNNEKDRGAPTYKKEIGRTNNQNPRERKPEEPEVGTVHNDLDDAERARRRRKH